MTPTQISYRDMSTPVGDLRLLASARGITAIQWLHGRPDQDQASISADSATAQRRFLDQAKHELAEYFAGDRRAFTVTLDASGTEFQHLVWQALYTIPYGETRSYANLARAIGRPFATRAIGQANARNPIPIITPCHRVVGADGSLTGFSGGVERKRRLLALEADGRVVARAPVLQERDTGS